MVVAGSTRLPMRERVRCPMRDSEVDEKRCKEEEEKRGWVRHKRTAQALVAPAALS